MNLHGTAEHLAALPGLLEDADVYCFEGPTGREGWDSTLAWVSNLDVSGNPEFVDRLLNPQAGVQRILPPIRGAAAEMEVRAVAGKKLAIGHFDLQPESGDPDLSVEFARLQYNDSIFNNTSSIFDDALRNLESYASEHVRIQGQREDIILGPTTAGANEQDKVTAGRFEQEMGRIFAEHPELKDKPEVKVVATYGSFHTPLYHRAHAAGVTVEKSFPEMPQVYDPRTELSRTLAFGRQPSRELLVQCYADRAIRSALHLDNIGLARFSQDSDIIRYIRTRSVAFGEDGAMRVFDAVAQDGRDFLQRQQALVTTVDTILHEKGFGSLPRSMEELKADIARQARQQAERKEQILREHSAKGQMR